MTQIKTDWTQYYQQTPKYTSVARSISANKIVGLLASNLRNRTIAVCELGGANSCFVDTICSHLDVKGYHVVDLNEFGLNLLKKKSISGLTFERGDVLAPYVDDQLYDVVYSVGLIEHFDPVGTKRAVAAHFERCKPGGLVLITFPTPTIIYRAIRGAAERMGKWSFPDERPLQFEEVLRACEPRGAVLHTSINWWIGLTQGYVLARKTIG